MSAYYFCTGALEMKQYVNVIAMLIWNEGEDKINKKGGQY